MHSNPMGQGTHSLMASLAQPGGNVTGVTLLAGERREGTLFAPHATSASRRVRKREAGPSPDVLPPGGRLLCLRERPDILVESKDIRRIVLLLHLHQACVVGPKRLAHPLRLIGPEVIYVHAAHSVRV